MLSGAPEEKLLRGPEIFLEIQWKILCSEFVYLTILFSGTQKQFISGGRMPSMDAHGRVVADAELHTLEVHVVQNAVHGGAVHLRRWRRGGLGFQRSGLR